MTAAVITLAVVVAGSLAATVALAFAYRRALDDVRIAAEDRILVAADREQLAADLARVTAERDIARAVVGSTRVAAVVAAEEHARAVETAAATDTPAALAARVDELLGRPLAGLGPAGAPGRGEPGPAAVPAAADAGADGAGARPGA